MRKSLQISAKTMQQIAMGKKVYKKGKHGALRQSVWNGICDNLFNNYGAIHCQLKYNNGNTIGTIIAENDLHQVVFTGSIILA